LVFEDGSKYPSGVLRILIGPDRAEEGIRDQLAANEVAPLATPSADWETTRHYIVMWLQELLASIDQGELALSETDDAELAARIQQGLIARRQLYAVVESALRDVDAEDRKAPE
jgi:hypothetical protein